MARPSSIDQLEPEIRDEIGRLRGNGHTIDEILAALRELDVTAISRSALGRHLQSMEKVGAELRRSQTVAEALCRQLGDAPASRSAQLNVQLMHKVVLDLFMAGEETLDKDALAALRGNPEGIMMLARALDHLTTASKKDADFQEQIEKHVEARIKKQAEKDIKAVARERGISTDVTDAILAKVIGVKKA